MAREGKRNCGPRKTRMRGVSFKRRGVQVHRGKLIGIAGCGEERGPFSVEYYGN